MAYTNKEDILEDIESIEELVADIHNDLESIFELLQEMNTNLPNGIGTFREFGSSVDHVKDRIYAAIGLDNFEGTSNSLDIILQYIRQGAVNGDF